MRRRAKAPRRPLPSRCSTGCGRRPLPVEGRTPSPGEVPRRQGVPRAPRSGSAFLPHSDGCRIAIRPTGSETTRSTAAPYFSGLDGTCRRRPAPEAPFTVPAATSPRDRVHLPQRARSHAPEQYARPDTLTTVRAVASAASLMTVLRSDPTCGAMNGLWHCSRVSHQPGLASGVVCADGPPQDAVNGFVNTNLETATRSATDTRRRIRGPRRGPAPRRPTPEGGAWRSCRRPSRVAGPRCGCSGGP